MKMDSRRDVILLATADWDHPFWTNKQHVTVALAQLGHRVLYIESVGLRPPRLERQDLGRIWRRLWRGLQPPRRVAERIWVWSPLLIPAAYEGWKRSLNQSVFGILLELWMSLLGFKPDLFWTYNPLTGLLLSLPQSKYRQLVYHCVDDLTAQPCMPSALIAEQEQSLCRASDQVFVTSPELLRTRSIFSRHIRYDPNVADIEHFARARGRRLPWPPELFSLPKGPKLGFVGAVSAYKLDLALLQALAKHRPDCQIILIGRVGEGDPDTDLRQLLDCMNVHLLGPRSYTQLPQYLQAFDLALLPCPINDYTRSMFPMKFFEYIAAGLPVIATLLPALEEYGHLVRLCDSHTAFLEAVDIALQSISDDSDAALPLDQLPPRCSYRGRTQAMMDELAYRLP